MCETIFVVPAEQYSQRLREREARLAGLDRLHARIGSVRLALGASFLIMSWLCIRRALPAWTLLLPVAAFVAVLIYHQRLRAMRSQAQRASMFYRAGLDRIDDRWSGRGPTGERFDVHHHIYGDDLDLFGSGSLFQLLCAARTQIGEDVLCQWLLAPAQIATIVDRHASIAELRDRLDLRESMAIAGETPRIELHPQTLKDWAQAPNGLGRRWITVAAPLIAGLAIGAGAVWAIWGIAFPLLALVIAEIALLYFLREPIRSAVTAVENAYGDLKSMALLSRIIETQEFEAAPLRALRLKLAPEAERASAAIAKLATIVNFVEARRNPLLAWLSVLLVYPLQTALAAERWRAAHGALIPSWLEVLGEMEALLSLARYAFEHTEYSFPQFIEGAPAFTAQGLGHPLIPAAARVCNDVDISGNTRVLLVSGSNMSGKSTLLRTVGINTVLAMAGAPVCARTLRITPLQCGASIRINDSLHEGSSRFYAEITRLRRLFEPMSLPLLFLLDELLQGTNSADRRIGAEGLIRALLARGAIGLISTHDLALTQVGGLAADALQNVHFQDELTEGKLKFDFKLRAGIVTKSNGLELMRSIGLDV
jgi:MutS domain V